MTNGRASTSDWIRGNVLGLAAIFLALSGTAYATHPGGANTISSVDIINGEVRNDDLAADSVGSGKIADRQVKNVDLSTGASSSNTIADGGIQGVDVRNETLDGEKLADLAVTIPKLAFDPATQTELNAHKSSDDHDGRYWTLEGNKGTVAGKQFLGTTDDEPLELWVNGVRALRLEPSFDGTNQSPNVIGGIADNAVTAGVHSATIAGGGRGIASDPATANRVTDSFGTIGGGAGNQAGDGTTSNRSFATVGGGRFNTASGFQTTVGGGNSNTASGSIATVGGGQSNDATTSSTTIGGGISNDASSFQATVGGGSFNDASGFQATVGGGSVNTASGDDATVGGGLVNIASGNSATVPGGDSNTAQGNFSFAAGRRAKANHGGAFVWADSTNLDMTSTAANQFIARASGDFFLQSDSTLDDQGGFLNTSTGAFLSTGGTWTNASDETLKQGFAAIEPREVLREVAELPVRAWAYEAEPGVPHIGPTAQDFHAAFGLGADERHIASVDADGIALAAIKGLNATVEEQDRRIARLEARLAAIAKGGR